MSIQEEKGAQARVDASRRVSSTATTAIADSSGLLPGPFHWHKTKHEWNIEQPFQHHLPDRRPNVAELGRLFRKVRHLRPVRRGRSERRLRSRVGPRHEGASPLARGPCQGRNQCRVRGRQFRGLLWSRNSRYVLTSSKDWNVIVWDLASDSDPTRRQTTIRFDAPVISASFHPRNSKILLVLLGTGETYLVDLRKDHRGRFELCEAQEESDDEGQSSRPRSAMTAARFDPSGRWVFIGTNTGCVLVFNTRTKTMVARHKISGVGIIKGLDFAKSGRRLVTNSSDRILRQFNLPLYPPPSADGEYIEQELEPMYRFNDPISKIAWHSMSYSPDGEWLAGGAADNANHKIYIWDISNDGQFAAVLDGGREPLLHIHWHPAKAMIASTTNQGNILIWHCPTPERWGAFAGGFEEVDENVEYEEREDEFDIEDEDESALRQQKAEEEEVDINGVDDSALLVDHLHRTADDDEDIAWALEEPDDDEGGWRLKVMIDDDDVY